MASFTTSTLAVAGHSITATFNPTVTADFASSTSSALTLNVAADSTSVAVSTSADPALVKKPITLTGTVTAASPGVGAPTGSLTFVDQSTGVTLAANVPLNNGQASVTLPKLGAVLSASIEPLWSLANPDNGSSYTVAARGGMVSRIVFYAKQRPRFRSKVGKIMHFPEGNSVTFTAIIARGKGAPGRHGATARVVNLPLHVLHWQILDPPVHGQCFSTAKTYVDGRAASGESVYGITPDNGRVLRRRQLVRPQHVAHLDGEGLRRGGLDYCVVDTGGRG